MGGGEDRWVGERAERLCAALAAAFKVTVTTNRAPPLLSSLFEDMLAQAPPSVAQAYQGSGEAQGARRGAGLGCARGCLAPFWVEFQLKPFIFC